MKAFHKIKLICFCLVIAFLGCRGDEDGGASAQSANIQHEGNTRTYYYHLPKSYNVSSTYPAVFALHGGGKEGYVSIQYQSGLDEKSDKENFIVIYPQGFKGNQFISWNAGECCGYPAKNDINDIGFIEKVYDDIQTRFNVDLKRIYVCGSSNGGMLTYSLMCSMSDKFAAAAVNAGAFVLSNPTKPLRPVPFIHFHSIQDEAVKIEGGFGAGPSNYSFPSLNQTVSTMIGLNEFYPRADTLRNADDYKVIRWEGIDGKEALLYLTSDGGHSWPGGRPKGEESAPPSEYINATDILWEFFKKYQLP